MKQQKIQPAFKVWLEFKRQNILGKGGAKILQAIENESSISKAAKTVKMSYRYVWGYIAKIEKILGEPVVQTQIGGKSGGGAKLTRKGKLLLNQYLTLEEQVRKNLST